MRIPDDLHADDLVSREHLLASLRSSRHARGITHAAIARLQGVSLGAARMAEHRTTWQGLTIMRYARAIGWRIHWSLEDLTVPDDGDVLAGILAAGDTSTPEKADRVHWKTVCYDLVRIRRATTSALAFADRLGIRENAVHHWEGNFEHSSVIAAQRHARALGGYLQWVLEPAPTPLLAAVPAPRSV